MRARTHLLFSLICFFVYRDFFPLVQPLLFFFFTLFAALLPDFDEATSTLGKKFFPVSVLLQWIFGHRGLLHSFFVPIFFFLLATFFQQKELGIALMLGYSSHILLDMTTVSGIRPAYPFSSWRIRGPLRTGSWTEWLLFLFLLIAVCTKLLFML